MQSRMTTSICSLAALSFLIACAPDAHTAPHPDCPTTWHAEWSSDSALSLCIPPGFERKPDSYATFLRKRDFLTRDFLDLYLEPRSAWESGEVGDRWPPSLHSGPCTVPDCTTTDSLTVYADTVAGVVANVYAGLVTGGFAGLRRQPSLAAGWDMPGERRLGIFAFSELPATLDTIRIALRTIRLAPR